jgi:hypothetical protein
MVLKNTIKLYRRNVYMERIIELLPLLIPLVLIQVGLAIYALLTLKKTEHVRGESRLLWVLIIIFVNLFGPILFLVFGRVTDDVGSEDL